MTKFTGSRRTTLVSESVRVTADSCASFVNGIRDEVPNVIQHISIPLHQFFPALNEVIEYLSVVNSFPLVINLSRREVIGRLLGMKSDEFRRASRVGTAYHWLTACNCSHQSFS